MKAGIMQPYFFPYLGHFSLIANVDCWFVFDITQYTPKSWMNRNLIWHPKHDKQYITVALSNSSIHIKTFEAKVLDLSQSLNSILGKLSHYRRKAPYYKEVVDIVKNTFNNVTSNSLVELNTMGLVMVCRYLNIDFDYKICSQMNMNLPKKLGAGDWALEICKIVNADEYINPIGGKKLFNPVAFEKNKIKLNFLDYNQETHSILNNKVANLSIIDILMWNDPINIKKQIVLGTNIVD